MQTRKYPGKGNVIFDPFAGKDLPKQAPSEPEIKLFSVFRPCGTCEGNGRGKSDTKKIPYSHNGKNYIRFEADTSVIKDHPTCPQCKLHHDALFHQKMGKWGKYLQVPAHELTDAEFDSLSENDRLGAYFLITQHDQHNQRARFIAKAVSEGVKIEDL